MRLNRRRFLLGASVAVTAAATGLRVQARELVPGPQARLEPVAETYFGYPVVDPYRWMENAADPDWMPWLQANDAHARQALEALPDYAALTSRMRALGADYTRISLPYQKGERLLFLRQSPDATWPVCVVREHGLDRVIFDPADLARPGEALTLEFWSTSHDQRFVALGLGRDGTEEATIYILDVEAEALLPDQIGRAISPAPAWLPDGTGFFYAEAGEGAFGTLDYRSNISARFHRLGDPVSADRIVLAQGSDPAVRIDRHDSIDIHTFRNSEWVTAETASLTSKGLWRSRLADVLAGTPNWIEVVSPDQGFPDYAIKGDELWIWGETGGRSSAVSRYDLAAPAPWVETIMATFEGGMLNQASLVDEGLYLSADGNGYSQLFLVTNEGDSIELPLPMDAAINDLGFSEGGDEVFAHLSTWLEPPSVWRFDRSGRSERIDLTPPWLVDVTAYDARRIMVSARDGESVPLTVILPRNLVLDGSAPCMVTAYGAYGMSLSADFNPLGVALLERGGILAIAHVRGGGERGLPWWRAGKGPTKPNTWRDLIDCCQHLVEAGATAPDRLGIMGSSAGGIAVGRAMTERPDLFALVVSGAGVLNPLRFEAETNGLANVSEFGSVTNQGGFLGLQAMDTLHHIQDGTRYPTVLLEHGVNDRRVAAWHSAKTAARLRAAGAPDSGNVYFRVEFAGGHLTSGVETEIANRAHAYALLLDLARG